MNLITVLKSSTRVGSTVVQNLRTIVVYHVLHSLLPQLGASPSDVSGVPGLSSDRHDTGGGLSKVLGHVRFSVPLVEWTHQALEDLKVLCEELAHEGSDDAQVQGYCRLYTGVVLHVHCIGACVCM